MARRPKETIARELVAIRQKLDPLLSRANALRDELRALTEDERRSSTIDVPGGSVSCTYSASARAMVSVTIDPKAAPNLGAALPPADLSE
jgi:hypothetical protein